MRQYVLTPRADRDLDEIWDQLAVRSAVGRDETARAAAGGPDDERLLLPFQFEFELGRFELREREYSRDDAR